jgi:hypothetical protein
MFGHDHLVRRASVARSVRNELRTEVNGAGRLVRRRTTVDDEQGRGPGLLAGLIDLNGGARGVVDDTDGPGKTVYVELSLDSNQASIR